MNPEMRYCLYRQPVSRRQRSMPRPNDIAEVAVVYRVSPESSETYVGGVLEPTTYASSGSLCEGE